jgi:hypothetical protein
VLGPVRDDPALRGVLRSASVFLARGLSLAHVVHCRAGLGVERDKNSSDADFRLDLYVSLSGVHHHDGHFVCSIFHRVRRRLWGGRYCYNKNLCICGGYRAKVEYDSCHTAPHKNRLQ